MSASLPPELMVRRVELALQRRLTDTKSEKLKAFVLDDEPSLKLMLDILGKPLTWPQSEHVCQLFVENGRLVMAAPREDYLKTAKGSQGDLLALSGKESVVTAPWHEKT